MGMSFKAGEAPWELEQAVPQATNAAVQSFKAGQAPWEQQAPTAPSQGQERFSTGESALQGLGQGISFGYLPELQAGAEVGVSKILPQSWGGDKNLTFQKALKSWRERERGIQAEDPLAYGGGSLAGALSVPIPGGVATKGASTLSRASRAAAQGATIGAITNPGETEGGVTGNLQARGEQALTGAAFGGGLSTVGSALSGIAGKLKGAKESLAMKLAGARKAHMKEIPANTPQREKVVGFMDKEGMLKPGQSFESVNEKATQIANKTGGDLGQLYQGVTDDIQRVAKTNPQAAAELDRTRLNARRVAAQVLRSARQELRGKAGGREALGFLRNELQNLADIDRTKIKQGFEMTGMVPPKTVGGLPATVSKVPGVPGQIPQAPTPGSPDINMEFITRFSKETPFEKLLKYRESLDDTINWQKKFGDSKQKEKALRIARSTVDNMLNTRIETVDKLVGSNRSKMLKPLKERYSQAKTVQRISGDKIAGEESKAYIGLLGTIAGTGYAGAQIAQGEDPAAAIGKGLVGGIALRQARKYGPGLGYGALKFGERNLGGVGQGLSAPGTARGLTVPWLLMNQGAGQ